MEAVENYKDEIERIMGEISCSKNFACYESGFEKMCRVDLTAKNDFLKCMSPEASRCDFSLHFDKERYFCLCPLRIFAANTFNK